MRGVVLKGSWRGPFRCVRLKKQKKNSYLCVRRKRRKVGTASLRFVQDEFYVTGCFWALHFWVEDF